MWTLKNTKHYAPLDQKNQQIKVSLRSWYFHTAINLLILLILFYSMRLICLQSSNTSYRMLQFWKPFLPLADFGEFDKNWIFSSLFFATYFWAFLKDRGRKEIDILGGSNWNGSYWCWSSGNKQTKSILLFFFSNFFWKLQISQTKETWMSW